MKIELSYEVKKAVIDDLAGSISQVGSSLDKSGHIGTHFDVMNGEFPIESVITMGRVFDISHIATGEVKLKDVDLSSVQKNDFVMFYSGILKQYDYGTIPYFSSYIELSDELVDYLIHKEVSFIGVDMAGAKKPDNHPRIDQYCADRGVFIIENLDNLDVLLKKVPDQPFKVYTFPVNWKGFSGLPCRVIAEI
ncbi:cyclase family protein [Alkaliphilus crotonatoxidans]